MRTPLLALAMAMFAGTASFAQEKATKATTTQGTVAPAGDEPIRERRELSGELKNALGVAEGLTSRAMDLAAAATGTERDRYVGTADALKIIQGRITEQLNLVNKATDVEDKGVFATAREMLASTNAALDEYRHKLKGGAVDKVPSDK